MIQISKVALGKPEEDLVIEVLRSGRLAQGPMVERFEQLFADATGVSDAIAVNSGTTALVAALQVCDLEPGDEVITTAFTFVATLNAILEAGAVARIVDISPDDYCIAPEAIESAVTGRTRVLLPVHLYGQPARMEPILALGRDHDLIIVEDAAQAQGAAIGDRSVGSFGLGCFSFYATKNLTTGEGGMITTDDHAVAERLRVLRNQGMRQRYEYIEPGHNYRMTELQAALALPQMERFEEGASARRSNADRLSAGLADLPGVELPGEREGTTHAWHQYTIRVTDEAPLTRDQLAALLEESGIQTGIYYPRPVFDYDCYRDHPGVAHDPVANATLVSRQVLSLPVHPHLEEAELDRVIETVAKAMSG